MSLPVTEIFPAIQGEGDRAGYPSVFIRLGGCNLTCHGFGCTEVSPIDKSTIIGCDSIHSVNFKHFGHTWPKMEGVDIVKLVTGMMKSHLGFDNQYSELPDVVITGGEPMLHHKNDDLIFVVQYFISRGHKVYVETNGTIEIDFEKYPIWKHVRFTLSVKMSNSGEQTKHRWKSGVVNSYLTNTTGSTFKFVLDKTLMAKDELFEFLGLVPTFAPVYIMPQGGTQEEIQDSAKPVYEFAMKNGFRYSDRLHIRIYNSEKGV